MLLLDFSFTCNVAFVKVVFLSLFQVCFCFVLFCSVFFSHRYTTLVCAGFTSLKETFFQWHQRRVTCKQLIGYINTREKISCYYGFSQGRKSLYSTAVYAIKSLKDQPFSLLEITCEALVIPRFSNSPRRRPTVELRSVAIKYSNIFKDGSSDSSKFWCSVFGTFSFPASCFQLLTPGLTVSNNRVMSSKTEGHV